ncbi:hypothetical protein A5621_04995 [Mycobacterium colombiense]|uniref:DUF732 domain-containing protein n=1 Tax=Mycobacterium colombiense TaxID=339268 RepID=A0A1A3H8D4_9MYCO|nr:hypothetical protein A5685_08995 [Mycobacterium colombiense]OBJ19159.1 hypothetical protein A5623_14310 [Mycobacterium colombiense]OBJ24595.1 hypothetical protein A9W93_09495 [Mycobacterium colombiense]OBJ25407.1 hypothetical protein A5621_04995 [Mycobacterium colombiense]OBJ44547.1 hypothetical protein A5620_09655 [Mycobacterium colombiense]
MITGLVSLAAVLSAPIRADMLGNAFLSALTNAGITYSQPATTTAMGQSVCPMLFEPGGSFDDVTSKMAEGNGLSYEMAGKFTIVAIATYCPAVIAPLLSNRLQS